MGLTKRNDVRDEEIDLPSRPKSSGAAAAGRFSPKDSRPTPHLTHPVRSCTPAQPGGCSRDLCATSPGAPRSVLERPLTPAPEPCPGRGQSPRGRARWARPTWRVGRRDPVLVRLQSMTSIVKIVPRISVQRARQQLQRCSRRCSSQYRALRPCLPGALGRDIASRPRSLRGRERRPAPHRPR